LSSIIFKFFQNFFFPGYCSHSTSFPGDCACPERSLGEAIGEPKANVTLGIYGYDHHEFALRGFDRGGEFVYTFYVKHI
jgi:hypothetical protein